MATAKPAKRKKKNRVLTSGQVHVQATYNNTIVTLCDMNGDVVAWASAGVAGFKGPKKATPYAAGVIVRNLLDKVADCGLREVNVFIKGVGSGREAAIRALSAQGINILSIKDVTPIPHNGPRPRKPRRV
ncbi:30S ribosomal protein S11 [Patescibacteria group bacterium]|nr:30S ribosomal protein S11 [Patescibacteria group bacterium]MBU1074597.1 30S ribosomal protein S11 [Patescibacteria group bacterium]MBU1952386.1 30S ribosomal protein S11 [Patescibacteria group bacterium]